MGCWYSRENGCYSLSCCFCVQPRKACYYIGGVGLLWGGFATALDYIIAYLPHQTCYRCLDYNLNANLSFAGGCIGAVQWLASILLIHGTRKELRWLLVVWLAWSVVSLAMQLIWVAITLPYTPSFRGFMSIFQLAWGIHFFIVVKTHYTTLTLSFTPPEEPPRPVPPNSPTRKHKRHKRRIDPSSQPPIRTLLGVSAKLQYEQNRKRGWGSIFKQEEPQVIVISRAGDPEVVGQQSPEVGQQGPGVSQHDPGVGQQPGQTTREDEGDGGGRGHKRKKKTRRRSSRKEEDLPDGGGSGGGHVQRPEDASGRSRGDRKDRRRRREGRGTRHGEEAEGRGGERRRRRRRREEVPAAEARADVNTGAVGDGDVRVILEEEEEGDVPGRQGYPVIRITQDVRRMDTGDITSQGDEQRMSQTSDNVNGAVFMDSGGPSSVTRVDSTQQTVPADRSYVQQAPSVEKHSRYPAGPEEMTYYSSSSPVPSTDPSKPEGVARVSSISIRLSRSPGLTREPSSAQEMSGDQSSCLSRRTSQSPGPSGDLAPSQGKLSESSSPGLSPDPSLSPGLSLDPSPSPGLSPDPSPLPGLSPDPSPSPGLSPNPSPSPGLSPNPSPTPGLSGEPTTSTRLTENPSPPVLEGAEAEVKEKLDDFEESLEDVECLRVESDRGLPPHLPSDSLEKDY